MQYVDDPCFHQLRTVEQLGYVVFSRSCTYRDVLGAFILVQSPTKSSEYLTNSINNFLKTLSEKVINISDEDFKT